ncbi:MAG: reverse transcriptase domain-containing protein, partial [Planctomycetota bacterium]
VACLLASLCTNQVCFDLRELDGAENANTTREQGLYNCPHLPQGAPTSPALANHCAYRLDRRLAGLAKAAGASYTRYADDLAFSGDDAFRKKIRRFQVHVAATIMEEGFDVHHRKTRVMTRSMRQQLAGVVVNKHANVARRDYEQLKAIVHNCLRKGVESQNRNSNPDFRSYLAGRIAHVEAINPRRGQKLKDQFHAIDWS